MKKYFSYILKVAMVFFMIIGFYNNVEADDPEDVTSQADITIESEIPDESGTSINVEHWEKIGFRVDFSVNPDDDHHFADPGDYIIISWPKGDGNAAFTPHNNTIPLYDGDEKPENLYARAEVTHEGATITFTDVIATKHKVKGFLTIYGRVLKTDTTTTDIEEFTIKVNGNAVLTYNVSPGSSVIGGDQDIRKFGGQSIGNENVLDWNIRINEDFEDDFVEEVEIVDNLLDGHQIIQDEIFLMVFDNYMNVSDYYDSLDNTSKDKLLGIINNCEKDSGGTWTYEEIKDYPIAFKYPLQEDYDHSWVNDSGHYFLLQAYNINNNYSVLTIDDYLGSGNFSVTNKGIKMTIPADKINSKFLQLVYNSEIIDLDVENYKNDAEMTFKKKTTGEDSKTDSVNVKYDTSTGGITGVEYNSLRITKIDSEENEIAGIYFKVTKEGNPDYVRYLVTDENGICELFRLSVGTYYAVELTEEQAKEIDPNASYPAGLVVDTDPRTIVIGETEQETDNNKFTVENTILTPSSGAFQIKKTVSGEAKSDKAYKVRITFTINGDLIEEEEISLKVNDPVIYTDLEEGTEITVTELESGYVTTYVIDNEATNKGTIVAGKIVKMTINNYKPPRKRRVPPTGI